MAQAEEIIEDDNEHEEAEELEKLLANTDNDGDVDVEGDATSPKKGGRFSFGKKKLTLVGGGTLLLFLLAGGAYFFLQSSDENPAADANSAEKTGEGVSTPAPVETVKSSFSKVHVFPLEPFFLPLKMNGRETGNFISVIPNLVLSNGTLRKELKNSLPGIRRNIYNVLSRKSPREYYSNKKIEERIKKEILITVNPILLAGTGTVTDVVFTQFVVK
jgi:flagellar basal body-associated protein FliL